MPFHILCGSVSSARLTYAYERIRNLRRMRGGDPPFRYTGWTVPMYSRQRWDPENNWRPTEQNSYYNGPTQKGRPNEPQQIPPYFDASHAEPEGKSLGN